MTSFEEVGIDRQIASRSISEANRNFDHSCTLCCTSGKRILCDRCGISHAHDDVLGLLATVCRTSKKSVSK
ncbi:MAG: hypothetical protein IJL99_00570 [Firmicutes bacterium]|nr:hypothetical protein [Clostridia bacterium]MBR0126733.1 hypothetical protein [Bacillota bacterium]